MYFCLWQPEIFNQQFHGLSGNLAQLPGLCELSPDFFPLQGGSKGNIILALTSLFYSNYPSMNMKSVSALSVP